MMQEDWEGFDFWRKNFLKKKKKLIFSIFFSIFFSAPPAVGFILLCKSALIFSALVTSPTCFTSSKMPSTKKRDWVHLLGLTLSSSRSSQLMTTRKRRWFRSAETESERSADAWIDFTVQNEFCWWGRKATGRVDLLS